MISEDEMTYRCGAFLALLLNVLATAMLLTFQVDEWPYATTGALANLFSYAVLIGALRRPGDARLLVGRGPFAELAFQVLDVPPTMSAGRHDLRLDDALLPPADQRRVVDADLPRRYSSRHESSWWHAGTITHGSPQR